MDATILVAVIGGIAALAGALIGAVPMYLQAKNQAENNRLAMLQNNELILHRLDEIDKKLEKQDTTNEKHDKHSEEIAQINARLDAHDDHIARLSRYHLPN